MQGSVWSILKVKIIGPDKPKTVEEEANEFFKKLSIAQIHKIETLSFPSPAEGVEDWVAILVYYVGETKVEVSSMSSWKHIPCLRGP